MDCSQHATIANRVDSDYSMELNVISHQEGALSRCHAILEAEGHLVPQAWKYPIELVDRIGSPGDLVVRQGHFRRAASDAE